MRAAALVASVVAVSAFAVAGCGGADDRTAGEPEDERTVTRVTPQTSCGEWPAATPEAQRRIAGELKRGGQSASERLEQIEVACRRYGDVSIAEALERLAVDAHRPTG